jgi:hypothetical protein
MNKIFNRQLFRTSARRPPAHGSGITQLVVDGKPVQGFADGSDDEGVSPAYLDEANMERTRTDVGAMGSDIPLGDFGFPINSDLRVNGRGAPPVQPPTPNEEGDVRYAQANTGTTTDARPVATSTVPLTTEQLVARDAQVRSMVPRGIASINSNDVAEKAQKYAEMYQKMYPGKSSEQYLEERKRLMGDDKESYQLQAALELAKLGATMASTPGSLAQSLAAGVNAAAPGLQKIADKRAERDRSLKLAAFDAAERDQQMKAQLGVKGLETAISQSSQERQAEVSRVAQENAATLSRIANAQEHQETRMFQEMARKDTQNFEEGRSDKSQALQLAVQKSEIFFKRDPEAPKGIVVKSYKVAKTKDGYAYVDDNGVAKTSEWAPYTETTAKLVSTDLDKPQQGHVIDKTNALGLKDVPIAWDKNQGKMMMTDGAGNWREAPKDLYVANTNELFQRKVSEDGRVIDTLIKAGPHEGILVRQNAKGDILNVDDVTAAIKARGGDPSKIRGLGLPVSSVVSGSEQPPAAVSTETAPAAPAGALPAAAPPANTGSSAPAVRGALPPQDPALATALTQHRAIYGDKNYVGRPNINSSDPKSGLLYAGNPPSQLAYTLTPKYRADLEQQVSSGERLLGTIERAEASGAIKNVGLKYRVQSLISNGLDPLFPAWTGIDWNYLATERGKNELRALRTSLINTAQRGDDRVSNFQYQQWVSQLPDENAWVASPKVSLSNVADLKRRMQNENEMIKAQLEDRTPILMKQLPAGTKDDPYGPDQALYLSKLAESGNANVLADKWSVNDKGALGKLGSSKWLRNYLPPDPPSSPAPASGRR